MKVQAVAAIANKKDHNGNVLSIAQLEDLRDTAVGKFLTVEFNPFIPPVGKIIDARIDGNKLTVEAEITDAGFEGYYIAPSYEVDMHSLAIKSLDYALTKAHTDDGATALAYAKD